MIDHYERLPVEQQDLDLLLDDLITVSGQLEELATS